MANAPVPTPARSRRSNSSSPERRLVAPSLLVIVVVAAGLRFGTLGLQSYWSDEAVTVDLVQRSLGHMLSAIPHSERTPPVYYVLAWLWRHVFGTGEVGLRSLSALCGTLTVLVSYAIGRRVAGERAGLIASALAAVSPILVWYSQEARSYSLLVLLCSVSVWLWLRARDCPSKGRIIGWGVIGCLAIATHYFASFIVLFEALSLVRRLGRQRPLVAVLAVMAVVQAALVPLAVHQARVHEAGDDITSTSLSSRIVAIPKRFLLGEHGAPRATSLFAAALVVLLATAGWLYVRRTTDDVRRRSLEILLLAVLAIALPLALALIGLDFFIYRNLLAVWVLFVVVLAAALSIHGSRLAAAVAAGLIVIWFVLTVAVDLTPSLQRADWRFSPVALGHPRWTRVLVFTPSYEAYPFQIYVPSARLLYRRRVVVREIDLIGFRIPPGVRPPRLGHGFRMARRVDHQKLSFVRYIANRPVAVDVRRLPGLTHQTRGYLLQR